MKRFLEKRLRRRGLSGEDIRLVADAEAFLSGDYAYRLGQRREPIPGWARLNVFAHSDPADLLEGDGSAVVRSITKSHDSSDSAWSDALQDISSELARAARGDPEVLSYLQRHVLVPLELKLMVERDLTALTLVRSVRAALRSNIP